MQGAGRQLSHLPLTLIPAPCLSSCLCSHGLRAACPSTTLLTSLSTRFAANKQGRYNTHRHCRHRRHSGGDQGAHPFFVIILVAVRRASRPLPVAPHFKSHAHAESKGRPSLNGSPCFCRALCLPRSPALCLSTPIDPTLSRAARRAGTRHHGRSVWQGERPS